MSQREIKAQTNFSGGQINPAAKRRDDLEIVKYGARQMQNWRIEAVGSIVQRPGRRAVGPMAGPRTDYVRMSPTDEFFLSFTTGALTITDTLTGNAVTNTSANYLWQAGAGTQKDIKWAQALFDIVITYPGMQPQVVTWDPEARTWSFNQFVFRNIAGVRQEPFYRFAVPGATMTPSGLGGTVTLTCSVPFFNAAMINRRLSIVGQQVVITGVTDGMHATADVVYKLASWIRVYVISTAPFLVGQIVEARTQSIKFEVGTIGSDGTGPYVEGTMLSTLVFTGGVGGDFSATDVLVSPLGFSAFNSAVQPQNSAVPQPTVEWQEEFMSALRGWPQSCAYDKSRLIFCDFPQQPEAILWSALGADDIFWIDSTAAGNNANAGANATAAILEFIPGKPRVRHVVGRGDEFVFTDRGIYVIPISGTNPLIPGSVEFRQISNDGCSGIRPVATQTTIVYINAGLNRVSLVRATGSFTLPYDTADASEAHQPLFTQPITLAIASGDGPFPERYIYVVNFDGTLVVGKFNAQQQTVGWLPWTGMGLTKWATSAGPNVWFTSSYFGSLIVEAEDATQFLDGSVLINDPPAGMIIGGGHGPLWHLAGQTVTLMDGARDMGDRQVDALGHLIVLSPTDDFSSATLTGGLFSPCVFQPFVPAASPGPFRGQRQRRRSVPRVGMVVQQSSGFTFNNETIAPVNWDEDATAQPVLRETTYRRRVLANSFDPGEAVTITKDRPGPIRLVEINFEVDA